MAVRAKRVFQGLGANVPTFNDPTHLVEVGLFAHSRNPMYLGFAVALLGAATLLGSASAFAVMLTNTVVTDVWYIRYEEQAMRASFGEAYADYCRRVRRWL